MADLEAAADEWLNAERAPRTKRMLVRSADLRYPLQNYEINVPLPGGKVNTRWLAKARRAFHDAHLRQYSYSDETESVQAVNLRVSAIGLTDRIRPKKIAAGSRSPGAALKGDRKVHFREAGNFIECPIYERELLKGENRVQGPAIIEQPDSTVLIPPSFRAEVDSLGRLVMTRKKTRRTKRYRN